MLANEGSIMQAERNIIGVDQGNFKASRNEEKSIDSVGRFGNPARRVARIPLLLPILFDRARENEVENDLSPPSAACISTVPLSFPPPRISPTNVS